MGKATEQQAEPKGKGTPITDLLIHDLVERNEMGTRKYGEPLMAFNGRDPLIDAYQELIDLLVYVRQYMEENKDDKILIMGLMVREAAELAWVSDMVETGDRITLVGEGKEYADKEDWIASWLRYLKETVVGRS